MTNSHTVVARILVHEMLLDTARLLHRGIRIPTEETHEALVAGQKYSELPIAHVHASYNNTIITVTDHTGTCGTLECYSNLAFGLSFFKFIRLAVIVVV